MLNYYLCIFTNKHIDIRSYQNHGQKGVFFYKVCRDPALALQVANEGRTLEYDSNYLAVSHSKPLLNYSGWKCVSAFKFFSSKDAYEAARSVRTLSRRPAIVNDVIEGIRLLHRIDNEGRRQTPVDWNGEKNVRILHGCDVGFVEQCIAARSKDFALRIL